MHSERNFIFAFFCRTTIYFSIFAVFCSFFYAVSAGAASYQQFTAGSVVTIGDFVYNDDYTPTTDPCYLSVYDPTGATVLNGVLMTADANGFHHYSFTATSTLGVWPASLSCGSSGAGTLVQEDETFVLVAAPALQSDIVNASSSVVSAINAETDADAGNTAATVNAHTDSALGVASSSIVSAVNGNAATLLNGASSSIAAVVNANTNSQTSGAVSSVNSNTNATVLAASSSLAASILNIPLAVWTYSSRSLTTFGALVSDIWNNSTRELTDAILGGGGNLALQSDVTSASSSLAAVVNANTNTQTAGITSGVNSHTDTALSSATSSLAAVINGNTNTQTSGIASGVNAHTDTALASASSSIAAVVNANTNTATAGITSGVNSHTDSATAGITSAVNANTNSALSSATSSLFAELPASIWTYSSRSLTTFGALVSDIWNNSTRELTDAILGGGGNLALQSDVISASSSVAAVVNANTNTQTSGIAAGVNSHTDTALATATSSLASVVNAHTDSATAGIVSSVNAHTDSATGSLLSSVDANTDAAVLSASSSLAATIFNIPLATWTYNTRTLTSLDPSSAWSVSLADSGTVVAGNTYRATVTTVYQGTLTDPATPPTITIYDANGNVVVTDGTLTHTGTGLYQYTYTTGSGAAAGSWESIVSDEVATSPSQTLVADDYWTVSTAPAQVIVNSMDSTVTPNISANITITDEGVVGYEYQYEWCVVPASGDTCSSPDAIFTATAAKFINPEQNFNTTLTATVPNAGTYYFKVIAFFGTQSSAALRSFTATAPASGGTSGGSSGGGGGGGGSPIALPQAQTASVACATPIPGDFNGDCKVDSIDFSILLAFWGSKPPFRNPKVDINGDGKVDSTDLSILLYHWNK